MAYIKKRSSPSIVISKKKTSSTVKRSSASQGVTIWGDLDDWKEDSDSLILVKKTGYYNFWIDGKHYFCDERKDPSKITNEVLFYAFNGGQSAKKKKKKKGSITITKK